MSILITTVRKQLEYNYTVIYRWSYFGELAESLIETKQEIIIYDGPVENSHLDDYIEHFKKQHKYVIIYCDPHNAREVVELSMYCKIISPKTKIVIYGRACFFIPQYFMNEYVDAIHVSGDREVVIKNYIMANLGEECELSGMLIRDGNEWMVSKPGYVMDNRWYSPKLDLLPILKYKDIYKKKNRLFEYAISASRGCARGCEYCETIKEQGSVDRRRNCLEIIKWCENIDDDEEYLIQLWSSNFFYDKKWLSEYYNTYRNIRAKYKWRAVGCISDLDKSVLENAKECNCVEIAVGIETIFKDRRCILKDTFEHFLEVIKICKDIELELKCLLMIGIPGQTIDDVRYTNEIMKKYSLKYRYTGYTPLETLKYKDKSELEKMDLSNYDRRLYYSGIIDINEFYKNIFK